MKKAPLNTREQIAKMVKDKKGFDNCLGCEQGVSEAQRDADMKWFKIITLQAIADEPEFPGEMPDELWEKMKGDKDITVRVMRNTVLLTKNGITERFLALLRDIK